MRLLKLSLWFALLACAMPARSQTDIHRCVDASGHAVFTDQTCASMQATAVTAPVQPNDDATPLVTLAATPTEPPPILCAGTFEQLRQSVLDAFASHNANRLAGLMLWSGYAGSTAVADIRAMTALMKLPLLDAGPPEDTGQSLDTAGVATPDTASVLVLHLASTDASGNPRELRYGVVRRHGCLWLNHGN